MAFTNARPPTKALLARALDRSGVTSRRDSDGDYYTVITGEAPKEFLQCWFLLEGTTDKIFALVGRVQPLIPWENLADALLACNAYHERFRFGRLYLQPADDFEVGIHLCFESQIDVTDGVSEAFLATFISSHLATICAFLAEAFRDRQLFGNRTSKPSRKRVSAEGPKRQNHRRCKKGGA